MLLDTSGLFCFYHRDEPQHSEAVRLFNAALIKVTHSYVLAEFVPLCQARGVPRGRALEFAVKLLDNPHVEFVWVDQGFAPRRARAVAGEDG